MSALFSLSPFNNKFLVNVPHFNNRSPPQVLLLSLATFICLRERSHKRLIVEMGHLHERLVVKRRKRKIEQCPIALHAAQWDTSFLQIAPRWRKDIVAFRGAVC